MLSNIREQLRLDHELLGTEKTAVEKTVRRDIGILHDAINNAEVHFATIEVQVLHDVLGSCTCEKATKSIQAAIDRVDAHRALNKQPKSEGTPAPAKTPDEIAKDTATAVPAPTAAPTPPAA